MITPRAYLVGAMGFCFYLILLFNTNLPSQFYALSWLSVGILVSSLGVALLSLLGLECEWRIAKAHVAEELESPAGAVGGGPLFEFTFANSGSFNKTDLLVEVRLHAPRRDEIITRQFLVEALPSLSSLVCELPLTDLPRGRYRLQSLTIHGGDVLGLYRVRRKLPLTGRLDLEDIIVAPATALLPRQGAGGGAALLGAAARSARGQGHGEDFRGTRPYVPGDDLRTVHWKSTARRGQLVVKEFHHREQVQRLIIWDGRAGLNGDSPFVAEFSLRLAMSLCRALAERGRACGLLRLDAHVLYLPAARGQSGNLSLIAEALADADATRQSPLDAACSGFLRHLNGASEVILVTAQHGPEVARAAFLLRSRGAHVMVALVNAAALSEGEGTGRERPRRRSLREWKRTRATLSAESAAAPQPDGPSQAQALRDSGFAVALVPPEAPSAAPNTHFNNHSNSARPGEVAAAGAAQMALLRAAVREVVEAPPPGRRAA